jgi:hypothetical protein
LTKEIRLKLTEKRGIISKAHPCLIQLIAEIGLNILKGNIKLTDNQYKTLKPYKRMLLAHASCAAAITVLPPVTISGPAEEVNWPYNSSM